MANFFNKTNVNTAITDHVKLDLSSDHITSANFMQYNVAWSKELVPGEKINVNMETFTRLQPMPVPTFGRARINNRAFFVPFRTVFPAWNDFITDTQHSYADGTAGIVNQVPGIKLSVITELFLEGQWQGESFMELSPGSNYYDFVIGPERYNLTSLGRQAMKILNSLGYNFLLTLDFETRYSALPLLAAAKVYFDWYYPSNYTYDDLAEDVTGIFNYDKNGDFDLTTNQVRTLLGLMLTVTYDPDYFTSAWENPTTPNAGAMSNISINVQDANGVISSSDTDNRVALTGTNGLTQFGLNALRSLTDYMKRHQLVGARALDRYLSRFGIQLSAEKLRRSVYIGMGNEDIKFGDVTATSDTEGAALGDYAGKGVGYGESSFDFETDEYGIMIIISTIIPKVGYFQGVDRNVMHNTRLDYWTPEFDNLGTQAISKSELYLPTSSNKGSNEDYYKGIFGWTPRYAEYKIGRDRLTGDFRYGSMNEGSEAWHLMRVIEAESADDIVISRQFVEGTDADQYSRIFYNTDADAADKFNVIYHFEVASYSPMKALYDTYEFEEKGKNVTLDVNGAKMN